MGRSTRACVYGSYYKVNVIYYSVSFINNIYNNSRKKNEYGFYTIVFRLQAYNLCTRF